MKYKTFFLTLIVLTFLLAACEQGQEFQQPPEQTNEQPNQTEEVPEQSKEDEPSVSARSELESLLQNKPTYKATYNVVNTVRGERITGTQVIAVKGNQSLRKFKNESFYILNDKVVVCRKTDKTTCYRIPQEKPPHPINASLPEQATVTKTRTRTEAGVQATCYKVESPNSTSTDCRTEDGILVYFHSVEPNYEVELTAQTITRNVPSSTFELPAEPQPLPDQNAQPRK